MKSILCPLVVKDVVFSNAEAEEELEGVYNHYWVEPDWLFFYYSEISLFAKHILCSVWLVKTIIFTRYI